MTRGTSPALKKFPKKSDFSEHSHTSSYHGYYYGRVQMFATRLKYTTHLEQKQIVNFSSFLTVLFSLAFDWLKSKNQLKKWFILSWLFFKHFFKHFYSLTFYKREWFTCTFKLPFCPCTKLQVLLVHPKSNESESSYSFYSLEKG